MRLNAYLARAGVASRRKADELIRAGKVTVNGQMGQLNTRVHNNDKVEVDRKPIQAQNLRYILINKPAGVVTTLKDPHGRRKILDLLSISERVVPVGRLDYDTTGALLLTNDGDLAHMLMHPSYEVDKVYEAKVGGTITEKALERLRTGVELDDGMSAPAIIKKLGPGKIQLTIHEGRKHQVKRMLSEVGLGVEKLHRSSYGSLEVRGLKPGAWRELTNKEIKMIKSHGMVK